jgi:hypothetical protein
MPDRKQVLVAFASACIALAGVSADAQAAMKFRSFIQNATNVCQAATKVGSDIRYRPKAVQNDGATPAFVSCSFTSQGDYVPRADNPYYLAIWASVSDGVADTLSCTAMLGYAEDGFQIPAVTKTVSLSANGVENDLTWEPSDFGVTAPVPPSEITTLPSGLINVSCKLNQGVGINDTYVFFQEDVTD